MKAALIVSAITGTAWSLLAVALLAVKSVIGFAHLSLLLALALVSSQESKQ